MRKIFLFMMISLDGFFEGPDHDLSWHNVDPEFDAFAAAQMDQIDTMLFGRRTYELMAGFWPTYQPQGDDPGDAKVAEMMNSIPKIVFSRTLDHVEWSKEWNNIRLIKDDVKQELMSLKRQPGKDIAVFGSSNLSVSLLEMGLLDELRIMVNPVAIGQGTTLFSGLEKKLNFKLLDIKTFASGNVLLRYQV